MIQEPEIVTLPSRKTAVVHLTIPRSEMQDAFRTAVHELLEVLERQGIQPVGPVFAHHLHIDPDTFDFELGVPVDEVVDPDGRVSAGVRAEVRAARTVYRGPYEGLPDAWRRFEAWIEESDHDRAADVWETYVVGPADTSDSGEWRTELAWPVAGGGASAGTSTADMA